MSWGGAFGEGFGGAFGEGETPASSSVILGNRKKKVFHLSQLSDGDRRSTAEFLKSHIAERVAFTQAPTKNQPKQKATQDSFIGIILASEL